MKTTKIFKSIFLLLLLMFIGIQNIAAAIVTYTTEGGKFYVDGVEYQGYKATAPYGSGDIATIGHFARITSLRDVTTAECVIPKNVSNGGQEYIVEGISATFYGSVNNIITSLTFSAEVGADIERFYTNFWGTTIWLYDLEGEDRGVNFSNLNLPKLKTLSLPKFRQTGTVGDWTFDFPALTDVYVTDGCPTLSGGMFIHASQITMHIQPQYIKESMKTAAVWSDFKAIVPFSWKYPLTFWNYSKRPVKLYSLGNEDYSETSHPDYLVGGRENGFKSTDGNLGENYLLTCEYDPETEDVPTVTRNDEPIDETDLFEVEDGVVGYQESNLHEHVSYEVKANHKHCRVTFYGGEGYIAGTYEIRRDGTRRYGNIFNGFIDCDYGSEVKLTMPATPYLLNNDLKLTLYNTGTTQNIALPTPVDGNYEIVFSVPSISSARFSYAYVIPQGEGESIPDPVITLMRMGEGEVKLTKFWEWDHQENEYRYEQTINCVNPTTSIAIPLPDDEGWGYRLEVTPLKGQKLRNLLVGYIMPDDNEGKERIYWGDYLNWTSYDATTNTYTFTVDMEQGGGDEFGMEDYNILVDMGPTETVVEDGYKQSIVCKGSAQSKVWFSGETSTELTGDCAATVVMDDKGDYDHFVTINLAKGEKFTAYRDGEDVTSQFEYYSDAYHYEFVDESYFYSSGWTIIFEKDENVVTGYDWTVVGQSLPEETKLTVVYQEADEQAEEEVYVLNSGSNKIHINASGLQYVRFDLPRVNDATPQITRDGQDCISDLTLSGNTYSLTVPEMQVTDAVWLVGQQSNQMQWTAVRNENTIGAELIVTRGEKSDTLTCNSLATSASITSASSAKLRVLTKVGSNFDVYLTGYGTNKIAVIKAVREITGWDLKDSKDLVDATLYGPQLLMGNVSLSEVMDIQHRIAVVGGAVSIEAKDATNTIPLKVLRDGVNVTSQGTLDGDFLCFTVSNEDLTGTTWVITTDEAYDRYDVNHDGHITIADVTKLVNVILGKE
jgi:large subunit ribosomal protein L7/L12